MAEWAESRDAYSMGKSWGIRSVHSGEKETKINLTDADRCGMTCMRLQNYEFDKHLGIMRNDIKYLDTHRFRINYKGIKEYHIRATGENKTYQYAWSWQLKNQPEFLLLTWGTQAFLDKMLAKHNLKLLCLPAKQLSTRLVDTDAPPAKRAKQC